MQFRKDLVLTEIHCLDCGEYGKRVHKEGYWEDWMNYCSLCSWKHYD